MTSRTVISALVVRHGGEHFTDGGLQADKDGATDNAMADIEFGEVGNALEESNVLAIQSVAGVDFQAQLASLARGVDQPFQLRPGLAGMERLGKSPGMELDELCADACGGFDLRRLRGNKQTNFDTGSIHAFAGVAERLPLGGDFQAAFGGNFLPPFGNDADDVGFYLEGDSNDLRRIRHFEIEPGLDGAADVPTVAIEDMAAIFAQMNGNPVGAGLFAEARGRQRVRFAGIAAAIPGLADGSDVIDIDAELE